MSQHRVSGDRKVGVARMTTPLPSQLRQGGPGHGEWDPQLLGDLAGGDDPPGPLRAEAPRAGE